MIEHFQDAVSLLEACVEEMKRQEAMFYAPFKPGDRITVERIDGRALRTASGPFMVVDVFPDTRYRYSYECVALTRTDPCTSERARDVSGLTLLRLSSRRTLL